MRMRVRDASKLHMGMHECVPVGATRPQRQEDRTPMRRQDTYADVSAAEPNRQKK